MLSPSSKEALLASPLGDPLSSVWSSPFLLDALDLTLLFLAKVKLLPTLAQSYFTISRFANSSFCSAEATLSIRQMQSVPAFLPKPAPFRKLSTDLGSIYKSAHLSSIYQTLVLFLLLFSLPHPYFSLALSSTSCTNYLLFLRLFYQATMSPQSPISS